jgi:hypothetical protein
VQQSRVQTQSKARVEAARSVVDSSFFRQPVVRSGQATDMRHRHDGSHFRRLNRSWLR